MNEETYQDEQEELDEQDELDFFAFLTRCGDLINFNAAKHDEAFI